MKASQCEKIVNYMKKYGSITQLQAYVDIGCIRLPARIYDLKRKGYAIRSETIKVKKSEGEYVPISRYSLQDTEKH